MGRDHRRRRHAHRDFWRAWQEERRRLWREQGDPSGEPGFGPPGPPPEMIHAWRQFFFSFMGAWPEQHWAFGGRRFSPWHQGLDSFNPFVANLLSKGGGLLPLVVLLLLAQKPRYGNEIMSLIAERTGGRWVANPGAIYPLMAMLEREGLVYSEWEDPHKRTVRIYRLTPAGKEELARIKDIIRPKLQEALEVLQQIVHDIDAEEEEEAAESDGPVDL